MQKQFDFKVALLVQAIRQTFARRGTNLPQKTPLALTDEFAVEKDTQWKAFLQKGRLSATSENSFACEGDTITRRCPRAPFS